MDKEVRYFFPTNFYLALRNQGSGFGFYKKLIPDPDPGIKKKTRDPWSVTLTTA
jgi:hypothetical protein